MRKRHAPSHRRPPDQREAWHFGAGIVSGASDNDPSTVATLTVVGSTTVYGLAWLTLLVIPMLAIVQTIAAQVGTVSKRGLEDLVRAEYGRLWAFLALAAMLSVNVLTLAADLEGGGAALALLTPLSYQWWLIPLGALTVAALVFGSYRAVERVLQLVPLLFLSYIGAAILAHPNWGDVLRGSFIPQLTFDAAHVNGALALLGTTLTAYAYVWETIEVSEEHTPVTRLGLVQVDATLGIVVAGVSFWSILVATGATLGVHHHPVQTAQEAAEALEPIAGHHARLIFAIGLLGSALVAIPVIAGTCAYVAAEMFGWRRSLDASFARAPNFYLTLCGCVALAVAIGFAGVSPIALLFASGIAGGIATPFTLALMLLIARNRSAMRHRCISTRLALAGWAVVAIVGGSALLSLAQLIAGGH